MIVILLDSFIPAYYRGAYPALAAYNDDQALQHWLDHGIPEGRSPNPFYFAHEYYMSDAGAFQPLVGANERETNTNLWHHWRSNGIFEGRCASPLFHGKYYLESNPDVAANLGPRNYPGGFQHYLAYGASEGRRPAAADVDWNTESMQVARRGAGELFATCVNGLPNERKRSVLEGCRLSREQVEHFMTVDPARLGGAIGPTLVVGEIVRQIIIAADWTVREYARWREEERLRDEAARREAARREMRERYQREKIESGEWAHLHPDRQNALLDREFPP